MPEICLKYALHDLYEWYMPEIWLRYTLDTWYTLKMYLTYTWDMPGIWLRYAWDMQEICRIYRVFQKKGVVVFCPFLSPWSVLRISWGYFLIANSVGCWKMYKNSMIALKLAKKFTKKWRQGKSQNVKNVGFSRSNKFYFPFSF